VNKKKRVEKASFWKLHDKLGKLGYHLSSINELLAKGLITFDQWKKAHDVIVEEYLNTWNKISRYLKKNNLGGEHEQEN